MTLEAFNTAEEAAARVALLRCCGSKQWADSMLARRPFYDGATLLSSAESVWWALESSDWLEAFSAHPKIGEKKLTEWAAQEQSGVGSSSTPILEGLANGNKEYEHRFGWIFLVHATGKTAAEMLELLNARLTNESAQELRTAAREQAKITELRLNKLLDR